MSTVETLPQNAHAEGRAVPTGENGDTNRLLLQLHENGKEKSKTIIGTALKLDETFGLTDAPTDEGTALNESKKTIRAVAEAATTAATAAVAAGAVPQLAAAAALTQTEKLPAAGEAIKSGLDGFIKMIKKMAEELIKLLKSITKSFEKKEGKERAANAKFDKQPLDGNITKGQYNANDNTIELKSDIENASVQTVAKGKVAAHTNDSVTLRLNDGRIVRYYNINTVGIIFPDQNQEVEAGTKIGILQGNKPMKFELLMPDGKEHIDPSNLISGTTETQKNK